MSYSHLSLLLLLLALSCLPKTSAQEGSGSGYQAHNYHVGYRQVNWCITGMDEPELHQWPFNQFVPLIRRPNRYKTDPQVRYDLRFYDIATAQKDVGNNGRLFKTMHVVFKAEKKRHPTKAAEEKWEPLHLEGLIIQASANPYTLAIPIGQFFAPGYITPPYSDDTFPHADINCTDCNYRLWARSIMCRKRAKIYPEHPTVLAWHYLQQSYASPPDVEPAPPPPGAGSALPPVPPPLHTEGKQSEVHSNFRFYSPKCAPTRRMMFTILAVRSFANHEYDVFNRGPYEVTIRGQNHQSDAHPSPYFFYYTHRSICHHYSSLDLTLEHPDKFHDFEMNYYFDCCIREEENLKTKVTIELLESKNNKSVSCYEKLYRNKDTQNKNEPIDAMTIKQGNESWMCFYPFMPRVCDDDRTELAKDFYKPCEPCHSPPSTSTEGVTTKPVSIYKRSVHGGLMIMTNFCLQPIVIYIARFYKETFNTKTYKGSKSWYWMHFMGGMVSSGMVYFGYFAGGSSDRDSVRAHVLIGDVYIITLALCYGSAWGRHKNTVITTIAEFVHGCFGYVTISLAIASVESAPGLEFTSKLLVYLMVATQGFFMVILTCHICLLDKMLGMRPKRRHFPTVEARFDEIAVPKGKFRIVMLIIFSSITFSLSTASTFFD